MNICRYLSACLYSLCWWLCTALALHGQGLDELLRQLPAQAEGKEKTQTLWRIGQHYLQQGAYDKALHYAEECLSLSEKTDDEYHEAKACLLIGQCNKYTLQYSNALNFFLQARHRFERLKAAEDREQAVYQIGLLYRDWKAYDKALESFEMAAGRYAVGEVPPVYLENMGYCHHAMGRYDEAGRQYRAALRQYEARNDAANMRFMRQRLSYLSREKGDYATALTYTRQLLEQAQARGETAEQAFLWNNIGFLEKMNGQEPAARSAFEQALLLWQGQHTRRDTPRSAALYTNLGVVQSNLENYAAADTLYDRALSIHQASQNQTGTADLYNYLAVNFFARGNVPKAIESAEKAIEIATPIQASDIIAAAAKILADIYQNEGDAQQAKAFRQIQEEAQQASNRQEGQRRQALLEAQLNAERQEGEFKLLIADREKQELSLAQLRLEAERRRQDLALREQEVALLQKEKQVQQTNIQNQQLEKNRIEQALLLTQKQLEADQRNQQIQALERQRQLQDVQQQAERAQQQKALELSQANEKLKQLEIEEHRQFEQFLIALSVLGTLLLCLVLYALWLNRRRNLQLRQKNERIEAQQVELRQQQFELQSKNEELQTNEEELRQSYEELEAIKDMVEAQRDEMIGINRELTQQRDLIERKNQNITASITYASRIQRAMLPELSVLTGYFSETFVLNKPRDLVSGDFYWFAQKDGHIIVTVADCTGHGVPGAFMSMIGIETLNNIVMVHGVVSPDQILRELHQSIRRSLRQDANENQDGMDIAICSLRYEAEDRSSGLLRFAGAKNPLFIVRQHEGQLFKGDKEAIGGRHPEAFYTLHTMPVQKGDIFYLYTDGFEDQFGGPKNRKFMGSNLRSLLLEIHAQPLADQRQILDHTITDWIGEGYQLDDICVGGFRI